jgi:hypothetical protein
VTFEQDLAALHQWHFFKEFVYSQTTFSPAAGEEVELADSLIWIGNLLFVYQLKQRVLDHTTMEGVERQWFHRKVVTKATKQVRDTLRYLEDNAKIDVQNHRGHQFSLQAKDIGTIHKLVLYLPNEHLPRDCRNQKYHQSRTAGFIHLLSGNDYLGLVRILLTPGEISEYLSVREKIIERWPSEAQTVHEIDLLGQYICGNWEEVPDVEYRQYVTQLDQSSHDWDLSGLIKAFPDRITTENLETDYYPIVRELALLKRNELGEFKKRFMLALEKARADELVLPYRITVPRTRCGFVFVPIQSTRIPRRQFALTNFTLMHKYDQQLPKCLGVSIADDEGEWFTAEWCYAEHPWQHEPETEQLLQENNPFRPVRITELSRYKLARDA